MPVVVLVSSRACPSSSRRRRPPPSTFVHPRRFGRALGILIWQALWERSGLSGGLRSRGPSRELSAKQASELPLPHGLRASSTGDTHDLASQPRPAPPVTLTWQASKLCGLSEEDAEALVFLADLDRRGEEDDGCHEEKGCTSSTRELTTLSTQRTMDLIEFYHLVVGWA